MRAVRSALIGAALGLAGVSAAAGQDVVCGRTVTSFQQIAAELAKDPALKPVPNGGPDFTAYAEEQPMRQWFVTKPHDPAVQAVICRALEQDGGRFFIRVESRCFGPKSTCDRLVAAFQKTP